jgi:hypothetical protein
MIDWAKPVQVLSGHEWVPATVLKVHGDGSVVVEWWASPTPTPTLNVDVFYDDGADEYIRNAPPEPREWWGVLFPVGDHAPSFWESEKRAKEVASYSGYARTAIVHVREVLP